MKTIPFTILAAASRLALANPVLSTGLTDYTIDAAGSPTGSILLDVSGWQFNDAQGSPLNQIMSVFIGHGGVVTGLSWDVNLTTIGASWASEAVMNFSDTVNLTVGTGDTFGVTNMNYSTGGFIVDLTDNGLPNILPDAAGFIEIEFFESFVDNAGTGDAFFEPGSTVTIHGFIPSPSTLALFGLGSLLAERRRR